MHHPKPNHDWKRIYLYQAFLTLNANVLTNPRNPRQHIEDGVSRWRPFDHMEKLIPEYSVRKSNLTQQAKVQVEQKFFAKSFCKFEMCAQFLM